MAKTKNIVANIGGKHWANNDLKKSSPLYKSGYVPYFVRRRMDFKGDEEHEIVDDLYVRVEFAHLNFYGHRHSCSREHIHALLEYMISKNTLFMPGLVDYDEAKLKKSGTDYQLANMAFRVVSKYIKNLVNESRIASLETSYGFMETLMTKIHKEDLITWINTCFRVGHEKDLASTHVSLLARFTDKDIHEQIQERMITYILVDSKVGEFNDVIGDFQKAVGRFKEHVAEIASGFPIQQAGAISDVASSWMTKESMVKYGYRIICGGHQVLGTRKRASYHPNVFSELYEKMCANPGMDEEALAKHPMDIALLEQDGMKPIFEDAIAIYGPIFPAETKSDLSDPFGVYEDEFGKVSFITPGTYLFFDPILGYPILAKHLLWLENRRFFDIFSYCVQKDIVTDWKGMRSTAIKFIADHLKEIVDFAWIHTEGASVITDKKYPFMRMFSIFFTDDFSKNTSMTEKPLLDRTVITLTRDFNHTIWSEFVQRGGRLARYAYDHMIPSMGPFFDNELFTALKASPNTSNVIKCANLSLNRDFLRKTYMERWVELHPRIIMNTAAFNFNFNEHILKFLDEVLTEEQWKTYPFPVEAMRQYPEKFKPLLDRVNMDRYILAYGIKWVEENMPVSITDIVESNSYVNRDVIGRYIDVILLDDSLREKFLANREAVSLILLRDSRGRIGSSIIEKILEASNFTNAIKCEVLYYAIPVIHVTMKDSKQPFPDYAMKSSIRKFYPGSGFYGRALHHMLTAGIFANDETEALFSMTQREIEEKKNEKEG